MDDALSPLSLSPVILIDGESCPRLGVVRPGRA